MGNVHTKESMAQENTSAKKFQIYSNKNNNKHFDLDRRVNSQQTLAKVFDNGMVKIPIEDFPNDINIQIGDTQYNNNSNNKNLHSQESGFKNKNSKRGSNIEKYLRTEGQSLKDFQTLKTVSQGYDHSNVDSKEVREHQNHQFKLNKLTEDDERERLVANSLSKRNSEFFKLNNKVNDINYRQLMEIKYCAQNMIYRKLFDEFSNEIIRRKKQAELASLVKSNEVRTHKAKEGHLRGLQKITKVIGSKITDQNQKVDKMIDDFKNQFEIADQNEVFEEEEILNLLKGVNK